jgi:hypothetical protein
VAAPPIINATPTAANPKPILSLAAIIADLLNPTPSIIR